MPRAQLLCVRKGCSPYQLPALVFQLALGPLFCHPGHGRGPEIDFLGCRTRTVYSKQCFQNKQPQHCHSGPVAYLSLATSRVRQVSKQLQRLCMYTRHCLCPLLARKQDSNMGCRCEKGFSCRCVYGPRLGGVLVSQHCATLHDRGTNCRDLVVIQFCCIMAIEGSGCMRACANDTPTG